MNEIDNNMIFGLSDDEVKTRINQGLTNNADISTDKTVKDIIKSNVFTYFNLIFLIISLLLIFVGSFRNLTIFANYNWKYIDWNCSGVACKKDFRKNEFIKCSSC